MTSRSHCNLLLQHGKLPLHLGFLQAHSSFLHKSLLLRPHPCPQHANRFLLYASRSLLHIFLATMVHPVSAGIWYA
jgi:hypothetical protein